MALGRKSSREITVNQESFRWAVSEDSGYSVLVVQNASGSGQKLEVQINWISSVTQGEENLSRPSVTPSQVAEIVESAKDLGWKPQSRISSAFSLRLKEAGKLVSRSIG